MHPDLVAYVSGSLDKAAVLRFERAMRTDPRLRRAVARARRRLDVVRDDGRDEPPPADLVDRTLELVADRGRRLLPTAPFESRNSGSERRWWRRMDVVLAGSVAATLLGVLLPGLVHLRMVGAQSQCANNLRELWSGLDAYRTHRRSFPDVSTAPRPAAAMVVPMLRDAGVLSAGQVAACPSFVDRTGDGGVPASLPSDFVELSDRDFHDAVDRVLPGYAYSLGYRDDAGRTHGPGTRTGEDARMPLAADAAPSSVGNSPNHRSRGQNVLYADGHVAFQTERRDAGPPEDDIFLNRANLVAAGLGASDVVLAAGAAAP